MPGLAGGNPAADLPWLVISSISGLKIQGSDHE